MLPLLMSYPVFLKQSSTIRDVRSRPFSVWIEIASAAFERSQTPTRRVRKVRFWSLGISNDDLLKASYIHAGFLGSDILLERRDGAFNNQLERLV